MLFELHKEKFLNFFAFACILFSVVQIALGYEITLTSQAWLAFTAKIFFLNHIHIYFTPLLFMTTQSGRNWVKERFANNNFTTYSVLFIIGGIVVNWHFINFLPSKWLFIPLWLNIGWSTLHTVMQSFGMSRIYRQKSVCAHSYDKTYSSRFFRPIAALLVVFLFSAIAELSMKPAIRNFLAVAGLVLILFYILEPIVRFRVRDYAQKTDCRLLLIPFAFVSPIALFGILSLHGVEYLFLVQNYFKNENKTGRVSDKSVFYACGLIILILCVFRLFEMEVAKIYLNHALQQSSLIRFFLAVSTTLGLYHYWVDGLTFSSGNETNRKWMLKNFVS